MIHSTVWKELLVLWESPDREKIIVWKDYTIKDAIVAIEKA